MSSVLLARSEAIKRNGRVQILPASSSDWTSGWRVQVVSTGEQLDKRNTIGSQVLVVGAPAAIVYEHTGRLTTPGSSQVQFQDPDRRPYAQSCWPATRRTPPPSSSQKRAGRTRS